MIIYNGIRVKDKLYFLSFKNEESYNVEIQVDESFAKRLQLHLDLLVKKTTQSQEQKKDSLQEDEMPELPD